MTEHKGISRIKKLSEDLREHIAFRTVDLGDSSSTVLSEIGKAVSGLSKKDSHDPAAQSFLHTSVDIIERFFADIQDYDFSCTIDRNKFLKMAEEVKDLDKQLAGLDQAIVGQFGTESKNLPPAFVMRMDALGKSIAFLMITLGEFYRTLDEIKKKPKEPKEKVNECIRNL